jgi:hypothetical protein
MKSGKSLGGGWLAGCVAELLLVYVMNTAVNTLNYFLLGKTRQLTCRFFITEKMPLGNEESLFLASKSSSKDVKLSKQPVSRDTMRLPFRFSFLKRKTVSLDQVRTVKTSL